MIRALVVSALAVLAAGCLLEDPPAGRGVNLTVSTAKLPAAKRAAIVDVRLDVLGDERLTQRLTRAFVDSGEGRVHYSAGAGAQTLRFRVDALGAGDAILASGVSTEVTLGDRAVSIRIDLGDPLPALGQGAAGSACSSTDDCGTAGGCVDGVCCLVSTCPACRNCSAGTGTCDTPVTNASDPTPTACAAPDRCDGAGNCSNPGTANGGACTAGTECASRSCVDGICCDKACDQPCQRCGSDGQCVPVTNAEDPDTCAIGAKGVNICDASGKCIQPHIVKDLDTGSSGSRPSEFMAGPGGKVFFAANSAATGRELWVSDGLTTSVVQVLPGTSGGSPKQLTPFADRMYFAASDGLHSMLWSSNGSDLALVNSSNVETLENVNELATTPNLLLFSAASNSTGFELFAKAPTSTTAVLVKDIGAAEKSSSPSRLTVAGGKVYFMAQTPSGSSLQPQLWVSDGTASGTVQLSQPGFSGGAVGEGALTAIGSTLYFPFTNSEGLWGTEGTPATTKIVVYNAQRPEGLVKFKEQLFLATFDGGVNQGEYARVGDSSTLLPLLSNIAVNASSNAVPESTVLDDQLLFFRARNSAATKDNLYVYDGNDVREIVTSELPTASNPRGLVSYRHWIFFAADPDGEYWITNGTVTARACQQTSGCFARTASFSPSERPRVVLDRLWFGADLAHTASTSSVGVEPFVFP